MAPPITDKELRRAVDDRLASVFTAEGGLIGDVLGDPAERADRRFATLLARSYVAVGGREPDADAVVAPATAVELLREYHRLRGELLVQVDETTTHSANRDPTDALLAGDYLFAAAFGALQSSGGVPAEAPFATLVDTAQSLVEAMGRAHAGDGQAAGDLPAYLDDTVGALGEAAAVLGATVADVDAAHRRAFAPIGHGIAVADWIETVLSREPGRASIVPPIPDEDALQQLAARRRQGAREAILSLDDVVETRRLLDLASTDRG